MVESLFDQGNGNIVCINIYVFEGSFIPFIGPGDLLPL